MKIYLLPYHFLLTLVAIFIFVTARTGVFAAAPEGNRESWKRRLRSAPRDHISEPSGNLFRRNKVQVLAHEKTRSLSTSGLFGAGERT